MEKEVLPVASGIWSRRRKVYTPYGSSPSRWMTRHQPRIWITKAAKTWGGKLKDFGGFWCSYDFPHNSGPFQPSRYECVGTPQWNVLKACCLDLEGLDNTQQTRKNGLPEKERGKSLILHFCLKQQTMFENH